MELVHGNRGKCAQPCRLPYELLEEKLVETSNSISTDNANNTVVEGVYNSSNYKTLEKGYLLSTKDLCALDLLPTLVHLGIKCFKIEGRLKNPEYVATVTRIYRKYIDLALSDKPYIIDEKDKKDLLQVFNRGGFSTGYLDAEPNNQLICNQKPNNMGIFLGTVHNFNSHKGYVTVELQDDIEIGDSVSLEKENGSYNVSELMLLTRHVSQIINNNLRSNNFKKTNNNTKNSNDYTFFNTPSAHKNQVVKIGRIKGNISIGDKIYKISSKALNAGVGELLKTENIKSSINCKITVHKNTPICMQIFTNNNVGSIYNDIDFTITSDLVPVEAINSPITKERIIEQVDKIGNTPFTFENIDVDLDDELYVASISKLNQLRRDCIDKLNSILIDKIHRKTVDISGISQPSLLSIQGDISNSSSNSVLKCGNKKISVLLNILDGNYNYSNLGNIDRIYVPLKYFYMQKYSKKIAELASIAEIYMYMPSVMKNYVISLVAKDLDDILSKNIVTGFVVSNISHINLLAKYVGKYQFVANYNMNIYNSYTISELQKLGISCFTLSPELDKNSLNLLGLTSQKSNIQVNNEPDLHIIANTTTEAIVYGNLPVMTTNYCLLSKSNFCLNSCKNNCMPADRKYFLKDRIKLQFRAIPDAFSKTTTIYNSKKLSISVDNVDFVRLDFMDENVDEINNIVDIVKNSGICEGIEFTNGNLGRLV